MELRQLLHGQHDHADDAVHATKSRQARHAARHGRLYADDALHANDALHALHARLRAALCARLCTGVPITDDGHSDSAAGRVQSVGSGNVPRGHGEHGQLDDSVVIHDGVNLGSDALPTAALVRTTQQHRHGDDCPVRHAESASVGAVFRWLRTAIQRWWWLLLLVLLLYAMCPTAAGDHLLSTSRTRSATVPCSLSLPRSHSQRSTGTGPTTGDRGQSTDCRRLQQPDGYASWCTVVPIAWRLHSEWHEPNVGHGFEQLHRRVGIR